MNAQIEKIARDYETLSEQQRQHAVALEEFAATLQPSSVLEAKHALLCFEMAKNFRESHRIGMALSAVVQSIANELSSESE